MHPGGHNSERPQPSQKSLGQRHFMRINRVDSAFANPTKRSVKPHNAGQVQRSRLEPIRHELRNAFGITDASGSAGDQRLNRRLQPGTQQETADALRTEQSFMPGKNFSSNEALPASVVILIFFA